MAAPSGIPMFAATDTINYTGHHGMALTEKAKAGMEIAARIIRNCKPHCQGVYIMALGWKSTVPELLKMAGI